MRRSDFAEALEKSARRWGAQLSQSETFLFRRRYNLPPTDPRFLNATADEIIVDNWAHAHADNPKLHDEVETEDFDAELDRLEAEARANAAPPEAEFPPDPGDWETVIEERYT